MMDRAILGDNQFFAVNHLSDERSRAQAIRFKDNRAIIDVLDQAMECGVNTFMCTTHDRIAGICDHMRKNPAKYGDFKFFPGMPYAHKYANALTELGILGTLQAYIPGNIFAVTGKAGLAFLRKDFPSLMELLVDAEMKMFEGMNTPVIFLQNVIVDLMLGLGNGTVLTFKLNNLPAPGVNVGDEILVEYTGDVLSAPVATKIALAQPDAARVEGVRTIDVYRNEEIPVAETFDLGRYDGAVFTCASSARRIAAHSRGATSAFAIGPKTAAALAECGFLDVKTAEEPTLDSLVDNIVSSTTCTTRKD